MMNQTKNFAAFIGIDWADKKHDVVMRINGDESVERLVLDHRPESIDDWAIGLRRRFEGQLIAVCLEQRKGPLIYALSKYDYLYLFPVNPLMLAKFRSAFTPSGAKDDPTDADLILDIMMTHGDKIDPWMPDDPATREIRQMTQSRRLLVGMRIRLTNQLTANLKAYFPQALDCFENIDTVLACDLLVRWECLDQLQRARKQTLFDFFNKHGVRNDKLIEKRIGTIKKSVCNTDDFAIVNPGIALTRVLVALLREVLDAIAEYDQSIASLFSKHPDAHIFNSLPGAGPVFAPRLLAAFGDKRERFDSALSVQQYGGIAPVTERSGKSSWVHWRYACSDFIRQSFVEWAGMSLRYSYWASAFYQYQKEKGKTHNVAIRALAFKWIRIIYRCWKKGTEYDESKYLFSLRKNKSPLLKYLAEGVD